LFLWDNKKIFKYKLHQNFDEENMEELGFKISLNENFCFIKTVQASSCLN